MANQRNWFAGQSSGALKPILILSAILLILWLITLSQSGNDSTPEAITTEQEARLDSLRSILGTQKKGEVQSQKDVNLFENAFPVFLLLMILIIGLWWWSRKSQPQKSTQANVLQTIEIGPGQHIKAVQVGEEVLLLGVTVQSIQLLKSMKKEEWSETESVEAHPIRQSSFSSILKNMGAKDENA